MGVTTSFFSASDDALRAAAPGWITPEWGAFVENDVLNPFTGVRTRLKQHELLSEPPHDCAPGEIYKLVKRERAYAWKLPGGSRELEALMRLMTSAPDDEIAKLGRLALLGPSDAEEWVFEFPEPFVSALAALDDVSLARFAAAWQEELAWPSSPKPLVAQLAEVAREARASGHRMFSYVSL